MKPIDRFRALLDGKKLYDQLNHLVIWTDTFNQVWAKKGDNQKYLFDDLDLLMLETSDQYSLEQPRPEIKLTPEDVGKRVRLRMGI